MARAPDLLVPELDHRPEIRADVALLRFIACGSVDDGKSTLIGRLLYESNAVYEDQLVALAVDSAKVGTRGGAIDFSLLLDGLAAEREQGITIDVAYRYFSTPTRKFIVADTPGHEQYTRNMITGASTADAAVILVDARRGVLTQTRRHSFLVGLLGVRSVALAVNKLDLVAYSEAAFKAVETAYRAFAASIGLHGVTCIPLSATEGDNVTTPSRRTPWYRGPSLVGWLDSVDVGEEGDLRPLRMPVQWVNRPDAHFRGFSGRIVSGTLQPGRRVRIAPSGKESTIARIVVHEGDLQRAVCGESVTVTLQDEIDVSRGDLICDADHPISVADAVEATVIWMGESEMLPGRPYLMKIGAMTAGIAFTTPKYRIDVNSLERAAAKTLQLNEIGVCNLNIDRTIAFDRYRDNRDTGSFIVIDRFSNETVGAGLLNFPLRRSENLHWQVIDVDKRAHARLMGHKPCILWFTGISGAGKSTIANFVEKKLHAQGRKTVLLDGDNIRHRLNKDLGFSAADRVENIRRIAEVARLMVDAGLIVLVSFISPFRAERRMARAMVDSGEFLEIFVDTPIEVAEARDPKGLYKKARDGRLRNFTGVDSQYEPPAEPDIRIDTMSCTAEEAAGVIVERLRSDGILEPP
jgi:bifunctional enzyme CysN/CysC